MKIQMMVLIAGVCVTGAFEEADAGAWPRKQGKGFLQLGFSTIGYNKVYDDLAEKAPVFGNVHDNVLQIYADYGVTDRVTVTAKVPYKFLSFTPTDPLFAPSSSKRTNNGFGDIDLLVRYNWLVQDGYAFSNEVLFGLPTGDDMEPNGLWTGDGEFNLALRASLGKSFYPSPWFFNGDVAYNIREKQFSDEILYNVEVGYGLLDRRLLLILLLSGKESTSSVPSQVFTASALGFATNNQEYTAIIAKVLYKIEQSWGVSASGATATHGRNVAGGAVYAIGVFYEY